MFILKGLGRNKYNKNNQLDLVWNMQNLIKTLIVRSQ